MKGLITLVLASQMLAFAAHAQSTTPPGSSSGSTSPTTSGPVNPTPQSGAIRILTPAANQRFAGTNAVNVRFEIVSPTASAGTPNFLIQLDGDDPVRTSAMEQNFTGLAPGIHSVTVELVDANNTPIAGSRAVVQFVIAPQKSGSPRAAADEEDDVLSVTPEVEAPQLSQLGGPEAPPSEIMTASAPLPSAGSALPLISVIGFGVLVGGIASAMKTR